MIKTTLFILSSMKKIVLLLLICLLPAGFMQAQEVFFEDFGISGSPAASNDFGRSPSPYMPSDGFGYAKPYPQGNYNQFMINDNYYALVAPGYIKAGMNPANAGSSWWTPAFNEPNTVKDHSGTVDGRVMVINAGTTLKPFYERTITVTENSYFKASLWIYLVNASTRIAIDLKDLSGTVLTTVTTPLMGSSYVGKWTEVPLYFLTNTNCASNRVKVSFRNDYSLISGNDYYIDDLRLEKISSLPGGVVLNNPIPCPITPCNAGNTAPLVSVSSLSYTSPATGVNLSTAFGGSTPVAPTGSSLVWFNNVNHLGTALTPVQIANAPEGTYYAFFYDTTNDCYSPASTPVKVTSMCVEEVGTKGYNISSGSTQTFTLDATDKGFQLDIYNLDNSFNLRINNTLLTTMELDFQQNHTSGSNLKTVRFADQSEYGTGGIPEIWNLSGNGTTPILRFIIQENGTVTMLGRKSNTGPLLPLQLFNGNTFNTFVWNTTSPNTLVVNQKVDGPTVLRGRAFGLKSVICKCTDPANTSPGGTPTKVGITNQTKLAQWPENIPNGFIALESRESGLVITRVSSTTAITDPKDGMMVYDLSENCVKLYRVVDKLNNMGVWKCMKQSCNQY